jgi:hypothetical protein
MYFFIFRFVVISSLFGMLIAYTGYTPIRYYIILHLFICFLALHIMVLSCNSYLFEDKSKCDNLFFSISGKLTNLFNKV